MKLTSVSMENAAVHYLERFPASSSQLRIVLRRKAARVDGFSEMPLLAFGELVDSVVRVMIARGLLDDAAYARGLAESLHGRGWSVRKISARMKTKGLDADTIKEAIGRLADDPRHLDECAAWGLAKRKRLGPFRKADDRKERRTRDLGVLARAGFSFSIAQKVIDAATPD